MASHGRNLDASTGREVVYCHHCAHEWYRDERPGTLSCPQCRSEITEIVSPGNDPRNMNDGPEPPFPRHHHHSRYDDTDSDSDPEEEDIEEHFTRGPGAFFSRRTIYRSPEQAQPRGPRPDNGDDVIRRFTEMLGDMGGPPMGGRLGQNHFGSGPPRVTFQTFQGPGFTGGMGVSRFTITTGPGPRRHRQANGPGGEQGLDDPFQTVFSDLFRVVGPPPMDRDGQPQPNLNGGNGVDGGGGPNIAFALTQLLSTILGPNAVHGDAVYSQEALDRIITSLMEANPQSNAPPPASEQAIKNLPRKKLDAEMLGPELKGECTICIDEMGVGEDVVVLPCNHWFHEECVVLWLKEHNTCPVCRAAIEGGSTGQPNANVPPATQSAASPASASSLGQGAAERRRSHLRAHGESRLGSIWDAGNAQDRRHNSRRDSLSPPIHQSTSAQSSRIRSPSPSSRRSARSTQSERTRDARGSGSGPLHWLRDQFSGHRRS
ncbi:hypothetical protein F4778DRAFT_214123 [Xylariomycetidae sp. FL2044]|nr:hypothetical protein F4778DRAFT_214123 [Xylariomycetidae sp. FL2044]